MKTGGIYEFGPYRQDAGARSLTRHGAPVAITPKAFDALLCLVENVGRTVGREEMMRAVWPDTFVEDGNLNYNVSQLRKILGEFAPGVPYIQTLPKQGYRFVAKVLLVEGGGQKAGNGAGVETAAALGPAPGPERNKRARAVWATLVLCPIAATALTTWLLRPHRGVIPARADLVRLTSDAGLTMMPALSPDGKLVAYASDRGGEGYLSIWVQPVGSGEAVRLTRGPTDDTAPAFSPDGRNIAFRSEREGGGIYVVPALGGEAQRFAPFGRRPRFSPDGKWRAYSIGGEPGGTWGVFLTPRAGKIYVMPSGGGPSQELGVDFASAGYPIWTPDSRHILFLGNRGSAMDENGTDWWVAPIDGGPVVRTGASGAFRGLGMASASQAPEAWTADGGGVIVSAPLADMRSLFWVPLSTRNWRVSGAPRRLTFGTIMDMQPAVAGNRVVFASLHGSLDIWSLPLDTNRAAASGGLERLTGDAVAHSYAAVSADGRMLAFSSRRSGTRDIRVKDLGTGRESVVSTTPLPATNPNFSPDGRRLVYRVSEKETSAGYQVSLADGSTERLCEDCTDYGWSSDGKRMLLVGTSPARVSVLDMASRKRTALLDHRTYMLWNARFESSGRWVLFNATTPGRSRIFIAPVYDSGMTPEAEWIAVTEGPWDDKPRWSPDGNTVYFVSERDGFRCIWAQRLDAGKHPAGRAMAIFHAHEARRSLGTVGIGDLSLSVARDRIVFNMSERSGNLWMMNLADWR